MAFRGECISTGAPDVCHSQKLVFKVCKSNNGYYIGTICPVCGPYSRESELYWPTYDGAREAFESNIWAKRIVSKFHPQGY